MNTNKILNYKIQNILSFKELTEVSFITNTKKQDNVGFYTIDNGINKVKVSSISGIFGINSSGKSNLLMTSIACLQGIIAKTSHEKLIQALPFIRNSKKPSYIFIEFFTDYTFFKYEITFKNKIIEKESLCFKKKFSNKYTNIFKKENNGLEILKNYKKIKINLNNETVLGNIPFFHANLVNLGINTNKRNKFIKLIQSANLFMLKKLHVLPSGSIGMGLAFRVIAENEKIKNQFNNIAKEVELGFERIECKMLESIDSAFKKNNQDNISNFKNKEKLVKKPFPKFFRTDHDTGEEYQMSFQFMSTGTAQFIETIVFLLEAIEKNWIVFWDEFGCFLDEELIDAVFKIIASSQNTPKTQLIFNSNKKSIISMLEWDQIHIVKTNRYLESSVMKLDSSLSKVGIEKKYRNNYFGNLNDLNPGNILKGLYHNE